MCLNLQYFQKLVKTNVLAGDETKHVLLFIFHALYMCLTVEDLHREEQKSTSRRYIPCKYYLKIHVP